MLTAVDALVQLHKGNQRFVANVRGPSTSSSNAQRRELVVGQRPSAIVLGCSDSRVPAEIVFDQGLGALFVIRVAGNVVASSQVASVEFAAESIGTRLVVVLGHSNCGAVMATLEDLERPADRRSANLHSIVGRIRPAVEGLVAIQPGQSTEALLPQAVRANIRASANQLRHSSQILEKMIVEDGLLVVGAEYSLETGIVEFFDGVPEAAMALLSQSTP
jgi:carbonic anhydrase